jgi:hypothetical protein
MYRDQVIRAADSWILVPDGVRDEQVTGHSQKGFPPLWCEITLGIQLLHQAIEQLPYLDPS